MDENFKVNTFLSIKLPNNGEKRNVINSEKLKTRAADLSSTNFKVKVKNIPDAIVSFRIRKNAAMRNTTSI